MSKKKWWNIFCGLDPVRKFKLVPIEKGKYFLLENINAGDLPFSNRQIPTFKFLIKQGNSTRLVLSDYNLCTIYESENPRAVHCNVGIGYMGWNLYIPKEK